MAAELTNTKAEASLQSKAINTFGGNQNKSASDNELDARVDDVRGGGDHKSAKQSKSKLAPVKSLDSDKPKSSANQDDHHNQRENHQAGQTTTTKSNKQHQRTPLLAESQQQSTSGQHKQMFSLKQLAINSRNLAKKRAPLHQQAPPGRSAFSLGSTKKAGKRKELLLGLNSLSNSSSESSEACLLEEPRNRSIPSSSGEDLEPNPESGSDRSEFSDSQEDGTSYDSDEEDDYDEEEEEEEGEGENNEMMKDKQAKKKKKKKKNKLRQRQGSCCNCERFVNRIDCDGQPITDVDLVTYKHLCQMEQQAHQLRKSAAASGGVGHPLRCFKSTRSKAPTHCGLQRRQHRLGNNQLKAPTHLHDHQRTPPIVCRRSSLQEESGAYYELCTTPEERQIRQKYAWFPPSLKSTDLVDLFFSDFAKEKIPLVKATQTTVASTAAPTASQPQSQSQPQTQTATTTTTTSGNKGTSANASSSSSNGSSSLAGSHRDEQISFQLPRQDISLDYCSYPMSESSRTNYLQFVDKRNSQALDVGTVVQVKLPYANFSANSQGGQLGESSSVRHQRKASTVSQSAALVAAGSSGHQAGGQQPAYVAQRCRRCLVRFDNNQLAVLAPNFAIGTGFYRSPSLASNTTALPGYPDESTKLASRRASTVSSGGNSIMRDQPHLSTLKLANELTNSKPDATASKNIAMFHPKCFTCSTCKEFLVDLVYCLRDNKLYCLRHYGESLRPRCNWCQELIFSDEYLKAMNENFHVDHFLCRHCDSNLAGQRYVLKEEKPYCIGCYESNFANTCEDCSKPIGIDSRDLSYKDRHWHDTCFLCAQCQQSLIDRPFGSKADKVYCADCFDVTFATRCDGCKNPFRAGSKKMEYRGRQWHDSCFCCNVCKNTIGSNSFIPKNDDIYCIKCYEDKYATRCTKCKQVIVSGGVTFRNEPWHRDCFNCCNCNKSLAGQRFTTRDTNNSENNTTVNTNKTNQPHNAYCIDCYGELFAKKCFACTQAITGLGGTRFVTFEDRSWHNDCFICNDCQTTLVGKGFITDGPETILCGDCARAKLR